MKSGLRRLRNGASIEPSKSWVLLFGAIRIQSNDAMPVRVFASGRVSRLAYTEYIIGEVGVPYKGRHQKICDNDNVVVCLSCELTREIGTGAH